MPAKRFVDALQGQVAHEFAAMQQYLAIAVWYDAHTLPRLASFFYDQAMEERGHALMMVRYLLDTDQPAPIPGVSEPKCDFSNPKEPVELALEQEREVSKQIAELSQIARDESDLLSEHFMQWFLKEQVEEVATMSDLLTVMERADDNPLLAEEFIVRESFGQESADPTAPGPAGG
ncbi:MAG: ferritin [Solirubrobacterales bacterium]